MKKTRNCWYWMGGTDGKDGYGRLRRSNSTRRILAHRLSWEIHFGAIPSDKLVCHHCDHPECVRPEHLFLASNFENSADMVNKGRQTRGENHPLAKVTYDQVRRMRALYYNKMKNEIQRIAKRYGLTYYGAWDILRGRSWCGPRSKTGIAPD